MTKNTTPSEHDEQVGFLRWFENEFPGVLIYAIPNGEKRDIKTGKKLKREGVKAGVPDLHIPRWSLYIEMKRQKGGSLSNKQRDMITWLEREGSKTIVAKGAREASRKLLYLEKTKTSGAS